MSIGKYNKTIHNKFTSIHFKHHKIKISGKYTPYKVRDLQVGSDGVYLIKHINHKYNKHNKRNEPQESKEVFGKAKKDYAPEKVKHKLKCVNAQGFFAACVTRNVNQVGGYAH